MPPRLSTARKSAAGTLRPGRVRNVPATDRLTDPPKPPAELDPLAAREWKSLAPILCETGVLTVADLRLLRMACELLADISRLEKVIRDEGLTVTSGSGAVKSHPALNALAQSRAQAARLLESFGLSPRSRGGVDQAPGGDDHDDDPAAAYFR